MLTDPLIIYVPGLKPKPEPEKHRRELLRCLLAGVQRIDADVAEHLRQRPHSFDLVAWTYDFYGEHHDIEQDRAAIDAVIDQPAANREERAEAASLRRRLLRAVYRAADHLPFLIPHFADQNIEIQLRDLRRYARNDYDIADVIRRMLKIPLRAAASAGRPVLLIGHSMGSVIAYDSLWQLSRQSVEFVHVDLFMSMGSPLGQRYIQSRLLGSGSQGELRYPANVRRWVNVAAVGELTALDMQLANDFGEMTDLGLLEAFEDHQIYNNFRLNGELNVHAEYGYLVSEVTARTVVGWLRGTQVGLDDNIDPPVSGPS